MDFVQNDGFIGSLHKISFYSDEARVFMDVKVVDEDKESSRMLLRVYSKSGSRSGKSKKL